MSIFTEYQALMQEPSEPACLARSTSETTRQETVKVARASDPGYGRTKRITVRGKFYTEDRSAELTYLYRSKRWKVMWLTDGHGGDTVTKFVASRFGVYFKEFADQRINGETGEPDMTSTLVDLVGHLQSEVQLNSITNRLFVTSGCTFCACVIDMDTNLMTVANLGDSVCQVVREGVQVFRTRDHDAGSPEEQERIREAFRESDFPPVGLTSRNLFYSDKGTIRLHGGLMVTGGFGDYDHDMFAGCIRREPEISFMQLQPDDVVILSSDGLMETLKGGNIGPGRDETEICHDVLEYTDVPPTGLSLSQYLISSHVKSITQKLQATQAYRAFNEAQISSMVWNAKDNCDVITHRVSPKLALARSVSAS